MQPLRHMILTVAALGCAFPLCAKLPPPGEEAKAKAAEAAAKTAHAGKVDAFQLCKAMDKVAAEYYAAARKAGTEPKPPLATPPCVDPGPFVYMPAAAASAPSLPAPAPVAAAAPAAAPKK